MSIHGLRERSSLARDGLIERHTLYTLYTYLYIISPARYGHDNVEQDAERDYHANNETPCLHHLLHIKTKECNKKCFLAICSNQIYHDNDHYSEHDHPLAVALVYPSSLFNLSPNLPHSFDVDCFQVPCYTWKDSRI